jgi:hypothetical protein
MLDLVSLSGKTLDEGLAGFPLGRVFIMDNVSCVFFPFCLNVWSPRLMALLLVFLSIGHSCALLSISLVLPSPLYHLHFQNLGVYASISMLTLIGPPPRATHASPAFQTRYEHDRTMAFSPSSGPRNQHPKL